MKTVTSLESIQKLRVSAAYLMGLGIGITVTALQLTPKTSHSGDKYMLNTLAGVGVLLAAAALTWHTRRKEIVARRAANQKELLEKK